MKTKKILALLLAIVMIFALVACSKKDENKDESGSADLAGSYDIVVWVGEDAVPFTLHPVPISSVRRPLLKLVILACLLLTYTQIILKSHQLFYMT